MRVIAGAAKGRRLEVPRGEAVRPTGDRVREALFSSLQPALPGARVLDLFAGSGSLGLEAASRGAASVTLVERDPRIADVLRRNVAAVGLPGVAVVVAPAAAALESRLAGAPFDLVLADPPYDLEDEALAVLLDRLVGQLADAAMVVVERDHRTGPPSWPAALTDRGSRRYGRSVLHRAGMAGTSDS